MALAAATASATATCTAFNSGNGGESAPTKRRRIHRRRVVESESDAESQHGAPSAPVSAAVPLTLLSESAVSAAKASAASAALLTVTTEATALTSHSPSPQRSGTEIPLCEKAECDGAATIRHAPSTGNEDFRCHDAVASNNLSGDNDDIAITDCSVAPVAAPTGAVNGGGGVGGGGDERCVADTHDDKVDTARQSGPKRGRARGRGGAGGRGRAARQRRSGGGGTTVVAVTPAHDEALVADVGEVEAAGEEAKKLSNGNEEITPKNVEVSEPSVLSEEIVIAAAKGQPLPEQRQATGSGPPQDGVDALREDVLRVVAAARQFLRSRRGCGDARTEPRLRALVSLSWSEKQFFRIANCGKDPDQWCWDVVDKRANLALPVVSSGMGRASTEMTLLETNGLASSPSDTCPDSDLTRDTSALARDFPETSSRGLSHPSVAREGVLLNDATAPVPPHGGLGNHCSEVVLAGTDHINDIGGSLGHSSRDIRVASVSPASVQIGAQSVEDNLRQRPSARNEAERSRVRTFVPKRPVPTPGKRSRDQKSSSTRWFPEAAGIFRASLIASATNLPTTPSRRQETECKHPRRIQPTADVGCHWVCRDCGEELLYDGWKMEYSSTGPWLSQGGHSESAVAFVPPLPGVAMSAADYSAAVAVARYHYG